MYAILDANILYYWSGVQPSGFHGAKINDELKKYESFMVPLWSLIEIITSTQLSLEQKEIVLTFIAKKRLPVHGISLDLSKLIPADILQRFETGSIAEVIAEVAKFRFETERGILVFLLKSCVAILAAFYDSELGLDTDEKRAKFTRQMYSLILGNHSFVTDRVDFILRTFYETYDGKQMRNELQGLIYSLFYVASLNFEFATVNHFTVPDVDDKLTPEERRELQSNLANNAFIKKILKKLNSERVNNIIKMKRHRASLDDALAKYETEMRLTLSPGLTKYYSILIKKILTDGTKLEKNDVIDAFLFNYYPAYIILSAEKRIRNILKEIDETYSQKNEDFLQKISK